MNRLVILARKLDAGGAERQLIVLARGLAQRGRDVHVVLFYRGGVFDHELTQSGISVHYLDKGGRWDVVPFLVRTVRLLRQLAPSVIYSFLDVPNILASLARPLVRWPRLIWSIRVAHMDMSRYDWVMRMANRVEADLGRLASQVISNSAAGARWAIDRGIATDKLVVIRNGIDTQRFHPGIEGAAQLRAAWNIPENARLIGLVGRLDVMKDHAGFLHAAARLASVDASVRFVCVGDGPKAMQTRLMALAHDLGLDARLVWAGPRSDMPLVYNALDLLCLSSNAEGFPNVVGEAMACGVPCVVTDVGDAAHVVADCGEVVPPRDPDALSQGMQAMLDRLLGDPTLKGRARERVERLFSVARMVDDTDAQLWPRSRSGIGSS